MDLKMLSSIFEPHSIAVVGASNNETKWGGRIFKNILNDFKGDVYPVNAREKIVQGRTAYPSISEIPDNVEMAVIAVPSSFVLHVVEECGKKGVKGLVVVSAGFRETGKDGAELEDKLVSIVRKYGMRMIGPNTLGIVNEPAGLNASVIGKLPGQGSISFITQSGTLGLAIAEWTIDIGIGLSKVISTGNKAETDDVDLIEYLDNDPSTGVIAMYIEGIKRGRKFIDAARSCKKPMIAIKTGRSERGSRAVFSHTGSIAGSDEIFTAAFRQAGIIRVDTIDELFDAALSFSCQPLPEGNNVAIISNGGGASILATDACEKHGINIVNLEETTRERIKNVLPDFASGSNPVDTAGTVSYEIYSEVVQALLNDTGIDAVIVIYVHAAIVDSIPPARAVVDIKEKSTKPVITCWMGGAGTENGVDILKKGCMPNYSIPERAVKALAALIKHREFLDTVKIKNTESAGMGASK
ncbi:MAG: CoA-binding protein [Candidatus Methanoperedenaceae archaeon]|nr:CoA-binding protein [Candidatus Methanoperedenaceae archaeon]